MSDHERRPGKSRLVYDKEQRTIVTEMTDSTVEADFEVMWRRAEARCARLETDGKKFADIAEAFINYFNPVFLTSAREDQWWALRDAIERWRAALSDTAQQCHLCEGTRTIWPPSETDPIPCPKCDPAPEQTDERPRTYVNRHASDID